MIIRAFYLHLLLLLPWQVIGSQVALQLNGQTPLTPQDVITVAQQNRPVAITSTAMNKVEQGYQLVMQAAVDNMPIYGLTVGVGWNKDQPVFEQLEGKKVLSSALLQRSKRFNLSSLRAHAAGIGEPLPIPVVRAAMLIRLNTLLSGATGVQPDVAQQYLDFLNHGITPVVPEQGTVGEADITQAAHIGLAMVGEWDVFHQGVRKQAAVALQESQLKPLQPVGKDFLSILSNNSLTTAQSLLTLQQVEQFYRKEIVLFGLMLEGLNGNIAPFSETATRVRPFPEMQLAAKEIRQVLQGSSLWSLSKDRNLQDPLSYRTMAYTLGQVNSAINSVQQALLIEINASDDNPLVSQSTFVEQGSQLNAYRIDGPTKGAIIPTANFNFIPISSRLEQLNIALAKLSETMTQQLIRLEDPEHTKLPRFLADPNNAGHAFGAIQKPVAALNSENKLLAQPASLHSVTLAGTTEDTATWSGLTLKNTRQILNNLDIIASFQLLHATQAVELRQGFTQSNTTKQLFSTYRQQVPYISEDITYTPLIQAGIEIWRAYQPPIAN